MVEFSFQEKQVFDMSINGEGQFYFQRIVEGVVMNQLFLFKIVLCNGFFRVFYEICILDYFINIKYQM